MRSRSRNTKDGRLLDGMKLGLQAKTMTEYVAKRSNDPIIKHWALQYWMCRNYGVLPR